MYGESWIHRESGTIADLTGLTYGNGSFVALGSNFDTNGEPHAIVVTSADGISWVAHTFEPGGVPLSLAFGNGLFIATKYTSYNENAFVTSTDAISWTVRAAPPDTAPNRLTYGIGQFVAVGGICGLAGCSGTILTSNDGISWMPLTPQPRSLNDVAFGHDTFVAVGGNCDMGGCGHPNLIVTSTNGVDWVRRSSGTNEILASVAFGNDCFLVLGQDGNIFQSDPLSDMSPLIAQEPSSQTVQVGSTTTLSVVALGTSPFTYQWMKSGEPLPGATNQDLVLMNVQLPDSGNYLVEVGNPFGWARSKPAQLVVEPLGPLGQGTDASCSASGLHATSDSDALRHPRLDARGVRSGCDRFGHLAGIRCGGRRTHLSCRHRSATVWV
jgi:hypothetical protein